MILLLIVLIVQYAAREIPDAKVFALESGGHILMGNHERVRSEIVEFLKIILSIRGEKINEY